MQSTRYRVIQGIVSVAKEPPVHIGHGRKAEDGERNSATTQFVRQGEFLPEHVSQAVISELLSRGLIEAVPIETVLQGQAYSAFRATGQASGHVSQATS